MSLGSIIMGRAGIKEDTIDEENVEKAGAVNFCLFLLCFVFLLQVELNVEVGVTIPDRRCVKPTTFTFFMEKEEVLISRGEGLSLRLSS